MKTYIIIQICARMGLPFIGCQHRLSLWPEPPFSPPQAVQRPRTAGMVWNAYIVIIATMQGPTLPLVTLCLRM